MKEAKKLTPSMEDYLKEIYMLQMQSQEVRVTDIAALLSISKASVNKAVNILKDEGYIIHEHYGPVLLSQKGQEAAKGVCDNYKVCMRFLRDILEVEETQAAQEAHLMEHALSKGTRKKLKKFIKKQKKS